MSQQMQPTQSAIEPLRRMLVEAQQKIADTLPMTVAKYLSPERMIRVVLSAISRNPLLLQCSKDSIARAVLDAASLGLEPTGGALGHAYLVPFQNSKKDANGNWSKLWEAQLIVGYRGLIDLARRSGHIQSVEAHVVYEKDQFRIVFGRDPKLDHSPTFEAERGEVIAAYCVADFRDGAKHCEFMTRAEIDAIRERSKSYQFSKNSPWHTDYAEMARKTVVRRAAKFWPLSAELARAMDLEAEADGTDSLTELPMLPAATPVAGRNDQQPQPAQESAPQAAQGEEPPPADEPPTDDLPPYDELGEGELPSTKTGRITQQVKTQQTAQYRLRAKR